MFSGIDRWQGQNCQILGHSNVDARGSGEPLRESLLHGHQGCHDGRRHRRPEGWSYFVVVSGWSGHPYCRKPLETLKLAPFWVMT